MPVLGSGKAIIAKLAAPPGPTYQLIINPKIINEGQTATFTVNTTLVPNGTTLYYGITGTGITAGDFTDNTLTGSFTINNNTGSFTKTATEDQTTEGNETFTATIYTDSARTINVASDTATIIDTSIETFPARYISFIDQDYTFKHNVRETGNNNYNQINTTDQIVISGQGGQGSSTGATGVAYTPNGQYGAIVQQSVPTLGNRSHSVLTVIRNDKGVWKTISTITNPSTYPGAGGFGYDCSWHPDGDRLLVSHGSGFQLFSVSGDTVTFVASRFISSCYKVKFNPAGTSIAAVGFSSPFIYLYNYTKSNNNIAQLSNPATLPPSTAYACSWNHDGTSLAVAHTTSPFVMVYNRSGDTFTAVSALPAASANPTDMAWNHNGTSLAVSTQSSPFVHIYNRSGNTFTKLSNPGTLPTSNGRGIAWGWDGVTSRLAVAHAQSPYITIYNRSGDTFTKVANPSVLPVTSTATGVFGASAVTWYGSSGQLAVGTNRFPYLAVYNRSGDTYTYAYPGNTSPAVIYTPNISSLAREPRYNHNGSSLAICDPITPFIHIYNRSGNTFTKLSNPGTLPAGAALSADWNHNNTMLAVASDNSTGLRVYSRSGNTFTSLTVPTNASFAQRVRFNHNGTSVAAITNSSPYFHIWNISGTTLTKLANLPNLPTSFNIAGGIAWNHDNSTVVFGNGQSPFVHIYNRSGNTFTKLANPDVLPPSSVQDVAFSPDGVYLAVGHASSPFVTIYKRSGNTFTKLANPAVLPGGTVSQVKWSNDGTFLMCYSGAFSNHLRVYKRTGDTFNIFNITFDFPPAAGFTTPKRFDWTENT